VAASGSVGEPAGDGGQTPADGGRGGGGEPVAGEDAQRAGQVVRQRGQDQPGTVRPEPSGGEVGQPAVLQRGDGLFHHGVPAVVGLDRDQLTGPVGEERVVGPVDEQRQLAALGGSGAADHQPGGDLLAGAGEGGVTVSATSAAEASAVEDQ